MVLITTIHESLPYIDPEPTPTERAAAEALIAAELDDTTPPHPSLPALLPSHFTPRIEQELLRHSRNEPLNAIDLSRYESLSAPSSTKTPDSLHLWRTALQRARTSSTYLSSRRTNLALLEQYGKNAWLISNAQLEDILRGLERELAAVKGEMDGVVIERRGAQEGVGGEMSALEEGWRKGVGRVLETEVACEQVRREILERRRGGAV
ncbi:hypothetical protein HYALB_00005715 [Hymenoscyphus albidus]|uniref:BCAS2 family protein n=1 Tax=Hymenoscyphus albidus TaxID=595503 RepID=A0A9N9LJH3_9HELO|nr:hypothetical protein HYALB_00005715 [Hymenoscyphus albidus]